jgi:hypothetical protein
MDLNRVNHYAGNAIQDNLFITAIEISVGSVARAESTIRPEP